MLARSSTSESNPKVPKPLGVLHTKPHLSAWAPVPQAPLLGDETLALTALLPGGLSEGPDEEVRTGWVLVGGGELRGPMTTAGGAGQEAEVM